VLKKEQVELILKAVHEDPISGHLDEKAMIDKIKKWYYWNEMITDIKNFAKGPQPITKKGKVSGGCRYNKPSQLSLQNLVRPRDTLLQQEVTLLVELEVETYPVESMMDKQFQSIITTQTLKIMDDLFKARLEA
ncbi:43471_t:CDS:2, partial [Gigaspora margarita]